MRRYFKNDIKSLHCYKYIYSIGFIKTRDFYYLSLSQLRDIMGGLEEKYDPYIELEEILDILFSNHIIDFDEFIYIINYFNKDNKDSTNDIIILEIIRGKCILYAEKKFKKEK